MELTFLNDLGQSFVVEIDPNMELENVMALLEAESGIPVAEQSISHEGRELTNPKATIRELGVQGDSAMMLLRRKVSSSVSGRPMEQDSEMMRLQLLGNPDMMRELQQAQPELAEAAQNNPQRFAELLRQTRERQYSAELEQQREIERLNMDPFDVEAQQKIEDAIRQQAVMENMQHALEYSPEFFGRVCMLYIQLEVNGHPIKAFVDSGAQSTIMSPETAEACGLMRLIDTRFAGIARGVGTAKILGRVHSAQLKVADLHLPCSFTIMEGRDVDLLFGLDMLKAHQACIDLEKNCLRIQGREVRFLSEHELPDKAREMDRAAEEGAPSSSSSGAAGAPAQAGGQPPRPPQSGFPGGGRTLGSTPASTTSTGGVPARRPASRPAPAASRYPEADIQKIMEFGATREVAISTLEAAGGNLDVAVSLLF
ncbi:hypothetical protein D9611_002770 [Ephemerocybe angulata]|uniref:DNA damage-inducible protein 1 n=1 Tax=Ephemerocybe angulata TaxID=980116 RepID=A0A8H5FDL5_9AGAR|nr:hypothetical protein D9611_002770 [Tulosesus angulatus]